MQTEESPNLQTIGNEVDNAGVEVTIGPQFLELFSEQLYTSPNKTFEELVSNSWDAGATSVFIGLSDNLKSDGSAVWLLDNGESMDIDGFKRLWSVAHSIKSLRTDAPRPQIGKFGIGKLATYVLAHQLTYICCASDGKIRSVSMDYRRIGKAGANSLHIDPLPLPVRELSDSDLEQALAVIPKADLIRKHLQELKKTYARQDSVEFGGGVEEAPKSEPSGTWTLAVLTDLKSTGQGMQAGYIQRMLRTSLPLGSSLGIFFNGKILESSKITTEVSDQWILGPDLPISSVDMGRDAEAISIAKHSHPYPHIVIPGIGVITGTISLYKESIAGGKSNLRGASNGYFVNILGRLINPEDHYFGLENLSHAAWAKFRAAVRIDGLNSSVAINREGVLEGEALTITRSFLRSCFNLARSTHDQAAKAAWPDAGEILTEAWGTVPLDPLVHSLTTGLEAGKLPSYVLPLDGTPTARQRESWAEVKVPGDVINDVVFRPLGINGPFVSYDLEVRHVVVNESHPFVAEHALTQEQRMTLRDMAMADVLSAAYLDQLGVDDGVVDQFDLYRDQLLRLLARLRRRSGGQIAELLNLAAEHKRDKALERILGDALESLGFMVTRLGGSDNPEGVARAPLTPRKTNQAAAYSFTYDAKSTVNKRVKAGNVGTGGLVRHREDHNADFTLVVGPDFQDGALQKECTTQHITPMRTADLGDLVILNTAAGPLDLEKFKTVFSLYEPEAVHDFVQVWIGEVEAMRRITYADVFLAIDQIGFDTPDMLTTPLIAAKIRENLKDSQFPTRLDVGRILAGMSILTPHLVRVAGDNVFLGAHPDKLRSAIIAQLSALPKDAGFATRMIGVEE